MPNFPDHSMTMKDFQAFILELEKERGWLKNDMKTNCFLMAEELGELCKAVRKAENMPVDENSSIGTISEELVDIFNFLLAVANRAGVDLEQAFREKNAQNGNRDWKRVEKSA